MYERSTDSRKSTKSKKIHTAAEASDSQRMGAYGQRCGSIPEASDSSNDPVSVGESTTARSPQTFLSGKRPQKDVRIKELDEESRKLKEAITNNPLSKVTWFR